MKKLSALLLILAFSLLLTCTALAAPTLLYDFNTGIQSKITYNNDCTLTYTATEAIVTSQNGPDAETAGNGDVFATALAEIADADDAQWIKMRIKNESTATVFEFHFASDGTDGSITASSCTHFPISANDSEYKEYIFNIKDYNLESQNVNEDVSLTESAWKGAVSQLRFDFMWCAEPSGQVPTDSKMYVDYIAFFPTEEAAKAYEHTETVSGTDLPQLTEELMKVDYSDCVTFVFNNEDAIGKWDTAGVEIDLTLGFLRFKPTDGDPRISYNFNEDEQFDTAEVKYFATCYKAESTVPTSVYFVSTDKHPSYSDAGHKSFRLTMGEWTTKIVDLSENPYWEGKVKAFRWDIINGEDLNADIFVERIGFFKTMEQAEAFLAASNTKADYTKPSVFNRDMQTIKIPANTLYEGYNINDFILQSTKPDDKSNVVVKYTDKNGAESIVALCHTNTIGYTTFVAGKPGTYTLANNHKDYTDIADHWGESYINFVSDRSLFGGTSPTEFSPEMPMTRGMFITVLGRMHGLDTTAYDGNTGYGDVNPAEYYAPYIQWAKTESIMAGVSDTEFAPENPITRADMAVVIKNYIDKSGFTFEQGDSGEEFTDIAELDTATIEAINIVKSVGIINGKGDGKFDPAGISTRAEVATVMERVIKSILGIPLKYNSTFKSDRIMLGGWSHFVGEITEEDIKTFADAGLDFMVSTGEYDSYSRRQKMLNYCDKYGIQTTFHNYPNTYFENSEDIPSDDGEFYDHPSFYGHHIIDEPGSDSFPELGKIAEQYTTAYPGKVPFYNLLPMYANAAQLKYGAGAAAIEYYDSDPDLYRKHLEEYVKNIDTHYICVDIYPLRDSKTIYGDYCKNLDVFGSVCRENNRDFWLYIQGLGLSGLQPPPTEQMIRWQMYAGLSFGVKTFIYFTYGSYNESGYSNWTYSMIKNDGTPTPTYYAAQIVNNEIRAISDIYVKYQNVGAFNVNCTSATAYLNFDNQYKDYTAISDVTSDSPLLVGCFDEKEGSSHAFTLVNMENVNNEKAAKATFKAPGATTVTAYPFGVAKVLTPDANGVYTVSLDCGQGIFVTVE